MRSALCRCRRPTVSNGAAPARLPAPLPKCGAAPGGIYTALRIPPPRRCRLAPSGAGRAGPRPVGLAPVAPRLPPPASRLSPPGRACRGPNLGPRDAAGSLRGERSWGWGRRRSKWSEESPETPVWGWIRAECLHSPDLGGPGREKLSASHPGPTSTCGTPPLPGLHIFYTFSWRSWVPRAPRPGVSAPRGLQLATSWPPSFRDVSGGPGAGEVRGELGTEELTAHLPLPWRVSGRGIAVFLSQEIGQMSFFF